MSNVYLFVSHCDLGNRSKSILFENEMLEWFTEVNGESLSEIYVNAITALSQLGPFESEFCLHVYLEKKKLDYCQRCWGRIYLKNTLITQFSHDTRRINSPFRSLLDWPELGNDSEFESWSIAQWREFFINRIKKDTKHNLNKVHTTVEEAINGLNKAQAAVDKANKDLSEERERNAAIMQAVEEVSTT